MHMTQRNEPFRYSFAEPLSGEFEIVRIDQQELRSRPGKMQLLEISPQGAKIRAELEFNISGRDIELDLHFQIMAAPLLVRGLLIREESYAEAYIYGIKLITDESGQQLITDELKALAWHLLEAEKEQTGHAPQHQV